jgi:predicted permease
MWIDQFVQDIRYGARALWNNPWLLTTSVLTLAIGIGLVTVAFTIFNAYVLRPYAIRDPESLHRIAWRSPQAAGQAFRWRDYEAIAERADLFTAAVAESTRFVGSDGRPLAAALVSANYFDALAPDLAAGRGLAAIDAAADSAVLSHQAWVRLFDSDPQAIGRTLDVNGRPFVIVGIVGPLFVGLGDVPRDVWLPLETFAATLRPDLTGPSQPREFEIFARLRPGITARHAQDALTPTAAAMLEAQTGVRADVRPEPSPNPLSLQLVAVLTPVFLAFGLVLLTACANVSNVMLARAIARRREIAMRLSLGATRNRIVRQLLTEGFLVSLLAGVAGVALAAWALRALVVVMFSTVPPSVGALLRVAPVDLDYRVLAFVVVVVAAATLGFALLPAVQASRLALTDALRGGGPGGTRGSRLRSGLVIAQVAVSLVLVIAAATLGRNGAAVAQMDLGYDPRGVISINVRDDEPGRVQKLATALRADPRVAELAVTAGNPLFVRTRAVAAAPAKLSASTGTRYTFVSPEYFSVLRIPVQRGRLFREDEARASSRVAVISAATADAFWPGEDPVGQTIRIEPSNGRPTDDLPGYSTVTVAGVVPDVASGLVIDGRDGGHIYLPMSAESEHALAVLARGRSDLDLGARALQEIFRQVAGDPEVFEALPLDEMRDLQVYPFRAASWVGAALGTIALVLSVAGLYGVLSYTFGQRTREIGIRLALGATGAVVMRLVLGQSARLAGAGVLVGLGVALAAFASLNAAVRLEHVSLLDAAAFVFGVMVVWCATSVAAIQPARRAAGLDPAEVLRTDA